MKKEYITKRYESPLANEYSDLQSIRRDLNRTIEMLNLLVPEFDKPKDKQNSVLIEGLWSAGLIKYCRCFATGVRKNLDELDETIFKSLPGDAIGLHKWIKGMRDKLIAHSVNPFEECKTLVIIDQSDQTKSMGIGFIDVAYAHPNRDGVGMVVGLCVVMRDKIKEKCDSLQKELQHEVNKLTSEELKRLPEQKYTAPPPEGASMAR